MAFYSTYLDYIGSAYFMNIEVVNQLISRIWTVF